MSLGRKRGDRLQHLDLFVADRLAVGARRRLHRQVGQHLEQMVLDDVAHRPGLVVERAAALDAEILGHRDLHALDVIAIPERFQERVGEAEEQHVVHRPLAQVVVDAKDVRFVEVAVENPVQLLRRSEIVAERLFDDDARARGASSLRQLLDDGFEQAGRDGKVVRGPPGIAQFLAQRRRRSPGRRSRRRRSAAVRASLSKAAASSPPCFSRLSRARARNWSRFQPALATPMTGTSRWPRLTIACSDGKIFL